MSDAVLTAIIAATATLCASFMQLRTTLAREADARSRGQAVSRRRSRLPMILVGVMLLASAVGGFALSQWLGGSQRTAQADLQRELRERVGELAAAVARLERLATTAAPAAAGSPPPLAAEPPDPQAAAAAAAPGAESPPATTPPVAVESIVAHGPTVASTP